MNSHNYRYMRLSTEQCSGAIVLRLAPWAEGHLRASFPNASFFTGTTIMAGNAQLEAVVDEPCVYNEIGQSPITLSSQLLPSVTNTFNSYISFLRHLYDLTSRWQFLVLAELNNTDNEIKSGPGSLRKITNTPINRSKELAPSIYEAINNNFQTIPTGTFHFPLLFANLALPINFHNWGRIFHVLHNHLDIMLKYRDVMVAHYVAWLLVAARIGLLSLIAGEEVTDELVDEMLAEGEMCRPEEFAWRSGLDKVSLENGCWGEAREALKLMDLLFVQLQLLAEY